MKSSVTSLLRCGPQQNIPSFPYNCLVSEVVESCFSLKLKSYPRVLRPSWICCQACRPFCAVSLYQHRSCFFRLGSGVLTVIGFWVILPAFSFSIFLTSFFFNGSCIVRSLRRSTTSSSTTIRWLRPLPGKIRISDFPWGRSALGRVTLKAMRTLMTEGATYAYLAYLQTRLAMGMGLAMEGEASSGGRG
jgi:hypothetical protein